MTQVVASGGIGPIDDDLVQEKEAANIDLSPAHRCPAKIRSVIVLPRKRRPELLDMVGIKRSCVDEAM